MNMRAPRTITCSPVAVAATPQAKFQYGLQQLEHIVQKLRVQLTETFRKQGILFESQLERFYLQRDGTNKIGLRCPIACLLEDTE